MKALPYVCRAGFIKMNCLKQDTMALNKTATRLFSAKGGRQKWLNINLNLMEGKKEESLGH